MTLRQILEELKEECWQQAATHGTRVGELRIAQAEKEILAKMMTEEEILNVIDYIRGTIHYHPDKYALAQAIAEAAKKKMEGVK